MLTFKYGSTDSLGDLLRDARRRVMGWAVSGVGAIGYKGEQSERVREERLQRMLREEVEEGDKMWMDFEMEETQVKMEVADLIMVEMIEETVRLL